nr:hypothetical protein Iba_chr10dCG11810 [Ipomoea batatas]
MRFWWLCPPPYCEPAVIALSVVFWRLDGSQSESCESLDRGCSHSALFRWSNASGERQRQLSEAAARAILTRAGSGFCTSPKAAPTTDVVLQATPISPPSSTAERSWLRAPNDRRQLLPVSLRAANRASGEAPNVLSVPQLLGLCPVEVSPNQLGISRVVGLRSGRLDKTPVRDLSFGRFSSLEYKLGLVNYHGHSLEPNAGLGLEGQGNRAVGRFWDFGSTVMFHTAHSVWKKLVGLACSSAILYLAYSIVCSLTRFFRDPNEETCVQLLDCRGCLLHGCLDWATTPHQKNMVTELVRTVYLWWGCDRDSSIPEDVLGCVLGCVFCGGWGSHISNLDGGRNAGTVVPPHLTSQDSHGCFVNSLMEPPLLHLYSSVLCGLTRVGIARALAGWEEHKIIRWATLISVIESSRVHVCRSRLLSGFPLWRGVLMDLLLYPPLFLLQLPAIGDSGCWSYTQGVVIETLLPRWSQLDAPFLLYRAVDG